MNTTTHTPGRRTVGIQHRVKKTKDGEARPTVVHIILPDGSSGGCNLDTEQEELDWLFGEFVVAWRKPAAGEDLSKFRDWHVQRDAKTGEATKVPATYDGLAPGDQIAMVLGGSGDYFAGALAKRGAAIGATVHRIAPFKLDAERGDGQKDDDAELFAALLVGKPEIFEDATPIADSIAGLRVSYRLWMDAMKARIAAGNRFLSAFVGRLFLDAGKMPPEQALTKLADEAKAKDPGTLALEAEERKKLLQVEKDLAKCEIWTKLFGRIEGVGPSIGARIIAGVITVRRFATVAKFRKYCGAHCLDDGSFARRRNGVVASWSGEIRQGLYLLGDQFNRRPDTVWGTRLRENKQMYKLRHPHPVLETKDGTTYELNPETSEKAKGGWKVKTEGGEIVVAGKLRFTPAHLLKRALWRTITEFVEWLYDAWWSLEEGKVPIEPTDWLDRKEHRGIAPAYVKKAKKGKSAESVVALMASDADDGSEADVSDEVSGEMRKAA